MEAIDRLTYDISNTYLVKGLNCGENSGISAIYFEDLSYDDRIALEDVIFRLGWYESTNQSPEEIEQLKQENLKLKSELEELKKNVIVPKFKIGDEIYVIPSKVNYDLNILNGYSKNNKICECKIDEVRFNKYGYAVVCYLDNVQFYFYEEDYNSKCKAFETERFYGETWFTTKQEAEEALRKLEEK